MRKFVFAGAALVCLLMVSSCASTPGSAAQTWEEGGIRVEFQQKPTANHQRVDTDAGPVEIRMFVSEVGSISLVAAYNDYPAAAMAQGTDEQRLDGARDGAVNNIRGTFVSERSIVVLGVPGREFLVSTEDKKNSLVWRVFFRGNRMFQVGGLVPSGQEASPVVKAFFESLVWTKF